MYQDHLILPLFLLFYHSVIPPSLSLSSKAPFSEPSEAALFPSPTLQGELEGLQGWAFICLNFLWSVFVKPEKNQRRS